MGFERDGRYNYERLWQFDDAGTLAAGKGAVYGAKSPLDPASVWGIAKEPGATDQSTTGCCFEWFRIKNTGANALRWGFQQLDAQYGSPASHEIASGEETLYSAGEWAMVAIYSVSGTDFEFSCVCNRRPNFQDALNPSGHPGHDGDAYDALTADIDWLTVDSTYVTADATEY